MEVSKSIFKRQADFLEKNGKYLLQFTDRICNKYLVYRRENVKNRMKVIMVNEKLGF